MLHNDTISFLGCAMYLFKSLASCVKLGLQFSLNQVSSCTFEARDMKSIPAKGLWTAKRINKETELFSSIDSAFIFYKL